MPCGRMFSRWDLYRSSLCSMLVVTAPVAVLLGVAPDCGGARDRQRRKRPHWHRIAIFTWLRASLISDAQKKWTSRHHSASTQLMCLPTSAACDPAWPPRQSVSVSHLTWGRLYIIKQCLIFRNLFICDDTLFFSFKKFRFLLNLWKMIWCWMKLYRENHNIFMKTF